VRERPYAAKRASAFVDAGCRVALAAGFPDAIQVSEFMAEPRNAAEFWEERYSGAAPIWSGKVNQVLADIATGLAPGRALDLGCGEGGDAIWLADKGWTVTGVDLSPTAIARARAAAGAAGIDPGRIDFEAADLASWSTGERFDLVSAFFLHSREAPIPRDLILRRAKTFVARDGRLLVVSHVTAPSWADPALAHAHAHAFPTLDEELLSLQMPDGEWETELCETRTRAITAPTGETGTVDDGVVLIRRRD
jgi:SAM-dependent methyltransferase